MRKTLNWPALYAYLVCLVMLIAFIYAAGLMVNSLLDIMVPPGSSSEVAPYEYPQKNGVVDYTVTPEAQQLYDISLEKIQRDDNVKDIVSGALMLVIIIPIYIYHWRLGKRYRYFEGSAFSLHDLYYYMASLITLVVGVVALLGAIRSLTGYFWGSYYGLPPLESLIPYDSTGMPTTAYVITQDQVQKMIDSQANFYFPRDQLISQMTTFLVSTSLYIFHWLNAKAIPPNMENIDTED